MSIRVLLFFLKTVSALWHHQERRVIPRKTAYPIPCTWEKCHRRYSRARVFEDLKTAQEVGRRRRPTSSAFVSSFLQMFPRHPNKKCGLASYLMEHIYFEAQLCSEIATLKEKSKQIKNLRKIVWLMERTHPTWAGCVHLPTGMQQCVHTALYRCSLQGPE